MTSDSQTTTYSLLDFKFTPSQHQLQYQNQDIRLSKKQHDLLFALVQSGGDVIKKDDLIASIWPQQIVTDAALNKQITRLRQLLVEYDERPVVETIRGVGIRLIPEVFTKKAENQPSNKPKKPAVWVIALITLAALSLLWFINKNTATGNQNWQAVETINMAIIPSLSNDNWLNVGGVNYLSEKLLDYPNIQTIKPENNWFDRGDQDIFAIELSQMPGIEYVLMVENESQGDQFLANLLLRNQDQIVAKKSLQASSVSLLLNQIETWTLQQLDISSEVIQNQQQTQPAVTDFVMESYLRGLAAARSRFYEKAKQLLNTAVEQDPDFYPAWLTLADVETELGHFDKALGLINTLNSSGKLNDKLTTKLAPIEIKNLIYLNRLDEAQTLLDQSMQKAKANQDINTIMYNMNNQLLLNDYAGDHDVSEIELSRELLALTEKFEPSPNQIGARQHNLAVIYNRHSREPEAIEAIKLAITNFMSTNNYDGLLSSYRVWAEVHAYLAQFGDAKLVFEKAEPYISKVQGARTIANFWTAYAWVHYELGDLKSFRQAIDALNQMSIDYASLQPKVKALIIEADMAIAYAQFNQARTAVDTLLEIITPNPDDYPLDAPYTAALDMYLTAVMQPVTQAKAKKNEYLSAYPQLAHWVANELMVIDAQILVKEGFVKQAIDKLIALENIYLGTRDISWANDTNYLILSLLISDLSKPTHNQWVKAALDRLESRDHFVYPFKKFKAQWLAHENKLIQAITLLSELKAQAGDFWTPEDQLLLETWQHRYSQP